MKTLFFSRNFFIWHLLIVLFVYSNIFCQIVGDSYAVNINNIYLPLNNRGVIADVNVPPLGQGGQYAGHGFLFCGGFLMSGFHQDSLWTNGVASAAYIEDYLPGTINMQPNDPLASLYKLSSDDPDFGQSWQDWEDAVSLGADFYDGNGDGTYDPVDLNGNDVWDSNEDKPDLLGDITLWCVYNDARPNSQRRYDVEPKGIEIRQTVFAFDTTQGELANTIFIRYRITNTGIVSDSMNSVYFSLYADPDIGDPNDDLGGSDTLLNSTYGYNWEDDLAYGINPPAFFIDQLAGPIVYIPGITYIDNNGNNIYESGIDTPIDSAYTRKGELGVYLYPGAANLSMNASVCYPDGDPNFGDPAPDYIRARNIMLGYQRDGNIIDPCDWPYGEVRGGVNCSEVNPFYWYSGDPVSDVGWINANASDLRILNTTGPFRLITNTQIEILFAYIVGRGIDELNSITIGREISSAISDFHSNNFGYPIVLSSDEPMAELNNFKLEQNYPNPFNPSTKIKFTVPSVTLRQAQSDIWVTLKIYDVLGNEITTLVKEEISPGEYEVEFNAASLSSGVYFYKLQAGEIVSLKKMVLLK
jgi:hypothetical protein